MNKKLTATLGAGILTALYLLLTSFEINGKEVSENHSFKSHSDDQVKMEAFEEHRINKGDNVKLTNEAYSKLKKWLLTNI